MTTTPPPMSAKEAREIIARLGWTQKEAAYRLGVRERMMRYYLSEDDGLPPARAELLRYIHREKFPDG